MMNNLYEFEDCIELSIPCGDIELTTLNWVPYNPRKPINRYGCSITSLDGNDSGVPDLDSVNEYNKEHGTDYGEKNFQTPTKHSKPFIEFLSKFSVGRCHYLKLPPGGYFPWHRDIDSQTFRIIYTIEHCSPIDFIWLEDDKVLQLQNRSWYFINTRKKHAVFSFQTAIFAVFNVFTTEKNIRTLQQHFHIK